MKIPYQCKIEECASRDETRPNLFDQVLLDDFEGKPVLVSTDGRMMAILPVDVQGDANASGLVPVKAIEMARRAELKSMRDFAGLGEEFFSDEDAEELRAPNPISFGLSATHAILGDVEIRRQPIHGKIHSWRNVIPTKAPTACIALNTELLASIARAIGCRTVRLEITGEQEAIKIVPILDGDHFGGFGILMPVRDRNREEALKRIAREGPGHVGETVPDPAPANPSTLGL